MFRNLKHTVLCTFGFSALFCGTLFTTGCSSYDMDAEYQRSYVTTEQLKQQEGEIVGNFPRRYFSYLKDRLVSSMPKRGVERDDYQIVVLGSRDLMAFSPGGGIIILSRGLIHSLKSEAELAFVIAHELGHDQLGHNQDAFEQAQDGKPLGRFQQSLELEADRYAIGLMAMAGYDPRAAVRSLSMAYISSHYKKESAKGTGAESHPNARVRIKAILDHINSSQWTPPGTINRREFVKLQKLLRGKY